VRVYPAYGRDIGRLAARGIRPVAVGVLMSSRWWYMEHVARVCLKPDEWALRRWEFGYLHRQHVVAVQGDDCDARVLGELLVDLMWAGPRELWVCDLTGAWIIKGLTPFLLGKQVEEWVDRKLGVYVQEAVARFAQAQSAEAALERNEIARALELGRDSLPTVRQRQRAVEMVEQLFAGTVAEPDARAA
jgi:hypothetical protein